MKRGNKYTFAPILAPFLVFAFGTSFTPYLSILPFIYKELGFTVMEITWITVFGNVLLVVLEVPSGGLADLFSRKSAVLVGTLLVMAGLFLPLSLPKTLTVMFGWMALQAAGFSLTSGADRALLYDHLRKCGKTDAFHLAYGTYASLSRTSSFLATFLAGFFYEIGGFELTLSVAIAGKLCAIGALTMIPSNGKVLRHDRLSYPSVIRSSLVVLLQERALLYYVLFCGLLGLAGLPWEFRSLIVEAKVSSYAPTVAIVTAMMNVLLAVSLWVSGYAKRLLEKDRHLVLFTALPLAVLGATLLPKGLAMASLTVYVLTAGLLAPHCEALMNQAVRRNELRATVLSMANLCKAASYSTLMLAFGVVSNIGFLPALGIVAAFLLIMYGLLVTLGAKWKITPTTATSAAVGPGSG